MGGRPPVTGVPDLANKLGMKVGLYLDVAVGVQAAGSTPGMSRLRSRAIFPLARRRIR